MTARLRLVRWCALLLLVGCCTAVAWWGLVHAWRDRDLEQVIFIGAVLVPMVCGFIAVGRVGWAADRAGAFLAMDAHGLHHCLLPAIPWRAVTGIQLLSSNVDGQTQYTLVLSLDHATGTRVKLPAWRRAFDWCTPKVLEGNTRLDVPLAFARAHPQQIAGAALTLADRHGGVRIPRTPDGRLLA